MGSRRSGVSNPALLVALDDLQDILPTQPDGSLAFRQCIVHDRLLRCAYGYPEVL
jgi:hypothetical protein